MKAEVLSFVFIFFSEMSLFNELQAKKIKKILPFLSLRRGLWGTVGKLAFLDLQPPSV
jgi:hypothetical protein